MISGGRYHLETTWLDMHRGIDFRMNLSLICFSAIAAFGSDIDDNDFRCAAVASEKAYLLYGRRPTFGVVKLFGVSFGFCCRSDGLILIPSEGGGLKIYVPPLESKVAFIFDLYCSGILLLNPKSQILT